MACIFIELKLAKAFINDSASKEDFSSTNSAWLKSCRLHFFNKVSIKV